MNRNEFNDVVRTEGLNKFNIGDFSTIAKAANALGCIGGMLSVMNGKCRALATTWEWKEDIDEQRAQDAKKRAEEMIAKGGLTDHDYKMAEAKLQRVLVRLSVKN